MVRDTPHRILVISGDFSDGEEVVRCKLGWFDSGSFKKFNGSSVVRSKFGWFVIVVRCNLKWFKYR